MMLPSHLMFPLFAITLSVARNGCHAFSPATLPLRKATRTSFLQASALEKSGKGRGQKQGNAVLRKKWGVDNANPEEYWYNSKIHTLGNTGLLGGLHAAMAPAATAIIDAVTNDGENLREQVAKELHGCVKKSRARILDLCCGVGMSTRALHQAFDDAAEVIGIDTSPEMIYMARLIAIQDGFRYKVKSMLGRLFPNRSPRLQDSSSGVAKFLMGNAEHTELPDHSFDLITVMYAFHEAPGEGRDRILSEARRLLDRGGTLALIDISPEYTPSSSMLAGEPYFLDYQRNIKKQLGSVKGFGKAVYKSLIPGHASMWVLKPIF